MVVDVGNTNINVGKKKPIISGAGFYFRNVSELISVSLDR